jgi:hypothetical protein
MKPTKTQQVKPNFWKWLHKNRTKVVLYTFLTVIPLALIFTAYYGAYSSNNKVHFDAEQTAETIFIKDFIKSDEIDALTLNITWTALRSPDANDEGKLVNGYYDFKVYYTPKSGYTLTSVQATPVLQTGWTNIRSLGNPISVPQTMPVNYNMRIPFNFELPVRPLWFVEVEEASLYLKVTYTYTSASNNITKTVYVQYDLIDITPKPVVG